MVEPGSKLSRVHSRCYTANELFNVVRGKRGKRGENTWAGLMFYVWELGYCNQMSVGLINKRWRCWELVPLIIIFPASPRLVVGARVDWQQFFR
jgi:hypothetical protein